jgi:hypothetical protein
VTAGWLASCRAEAERLGLDPSVVQILLAFGGEDDDGPAVGLDELVLPHGLPACIVERLTGEVDDDQVQLFARRYRQVQRFLEGLRVPEARLLRIGLACRAAGILAAPAPRALRIRAVVDFYLSQGAVLKHRDPTAPGIDELAARASWRVVADGVRHARLQGLTRAGPVHVNLLAVRGARLRILDARPHGGDLQALVRERGAVAGVSGGFFLYSEPDIAPPSRRTDPVGLLVSDGSVVGPPVFPRAALLQHHDGSVALRPVGLDEATVVAGDARVRGIVLNRPGAWPASFDRAWGPTSPAAAPFSVALVGDRVVAVGVGALPIPLAGAVLALPQRVAVQVGDPVRVELDAAIRDAVAGGPMLLRADGPERDLAAEHFAGTAPPVTFSRDETWDHNLLPRMGVGLRDGDELVFAAVDGRNVDRAPGMTLRGTADLLRALGCTRALNLDGGSSKRMVVGGDIVDLPSTDVIADGAAGPVRPVHSAILVGP